MTFSRTSNLAYLHTLWMVPNVCSQILCRDSTFSCNSINSVEIFIISSTLKLIEKVESTVFSIFLFFQESEEEKEKIKMKKINFILNEVTWTSVLSLDSPILAHVEFANGFPLKQLVLENNQVFCK